MIHHDILGNERVQTDIDNLNLVDDVACNKNLSQQDDSLKTVFHNMDQDSNSVDKKRVFLGDFNMFNHYIKRSFVWQRYKLRLPMCETIREKGILPTLFN